MVLPKGKLLYRLFTTPGLCNNNGLGDYKECESIPGAWDIYSSDIEDKRAALCILLHELIEHILTDYRGIPEPTIAEYDRLFEERKSRGEVSEDEEPGDQPDAPYHKEHVYATAIEYSLLKELGLDSKDYEGFLDKYIKENK